MAGNPQPFEDVVLGQDAKERSDGDVGKQTPRVEAHVEAPRRAHRRPRAGHLACGSLRGPVGEPDGGDQRSAHRGAVGHPAEQAQDERAPQRQRGQPRTRELGHPVPGHQRVLDNIEAELGDDERDIADRPDHETHGEQLDEQGRAAVRFGEVRTEFVDLA